MAKNIQPAHVPSRMCCCCIPVRIGVIVISMIFIFTGVLGVIMGVFLAIQPKKEDIQMGALAIAVSSLFLVVALLGLWGSLTRRRGLVTAFLIMLLILLLVNIGVGAYFLFKTYHDAPQKIEACAELAKAAIKGDAEPDMEKLKAVCRKPIDLWNGLSAALMTAAWLFHIFICFMVFSYTRQLKDEEYLKLKEDGQSVRSRESVRA